MANVVRNDNPGAGQGARLGLLAAGVAGMIGASMLGRVWQAPETAAPASDLEAAISQFDGGALASGAESFHKLADGGDVQAAYWYGHALDFGLGTTENATAAIAQYEKAWAGGVVPAGTRLGELYLDGNKVAPDFAKARTYLTEAAQRGDARGALDYGRVLRDGIGGMANPVAGYAWLEIAALRGDAQATSERDRLLPTLSPAQQAAASEQVASIQATPGQPVKKG